MRELKTIKKKSDSYLNIFEKIWNKYPELHFYQVATVISTISNIHLLSEEEILKKIRKIKITPMKSVCS